MCFRAGNNNVQTGLALKGQCHEIFVCWFFHQKAPPGPLRGTYPWTTSFIAEDSQWYWTKSRLSGVPKIHHGMATRQCILHHRMMTRRRRCSCQKIVLLYFVLFEPFFKWIEKIWSNLAVYLLLWNADSAVYLTPQNDDSVVYLTLQSHTNIFFLNSLV